MVRDVQQLTGRTFDVLVVGGGIYGLAIARDAAMRGLSVALIERDDFGSGSTFNHLRTIHGGLRYLQHFDISRARESIAERRALARMAPHALRPLPFGVPLYRSVTKGRLAMRVGFLLDRVLTRGMNDGVAPSLRLNHGRVLSRDAAIERFPGMRRQGLTGAALFCDYLAVEADRLTFSWAIAASESGAVVANYVEAAAPILDGTRVIGVHAIDRRSSGPIEIASALVVNASGAGVDTLLQPIGLSGRIPLIKAMNLVTSREAGDEAMAGRSRSGRNLFLVPWRGRALFGTWESARVSAREDRAVTPDEVQAFVRELNEAFPGLDLRLNEITLVHRGLVPGSQGSGGRVTLERHEQVRDHAAEGFDGIMTVAGTKYTTARAVAERVTDRLMEKLVRARVACRTIEPLPGGAMSDPLDVLAQARASYDTLLPADSLPHLVAAYGTRFEDVVSLATERPELRVRLSDASPVIGAEIAWAFRHELAQTLADAVVRRTALGALGPPADAAVAKAAAIAAMEVGWDESRRDAEIAALRAFYGTLNAWKT